MNKISWRLIILLCLTLGLLPYNPEPHFWGKLKWVAGGANGMKAMDWFDFFMHGAPWLLLISKTIHVIYHQFILSKKDN